VDYGKAQTEGTEPTFWPPLRVIAGVCRMHPSALCLQQ